MVENRHSFCLISKSPEETFRIGGIFGLCLGRGDCIALTGELGAGKTCFTQGIAHGLGVPDSYTVSSPTFTLLNEYPGRDTDLYHLDVYRLHGSDDLDEMGYQEYLQKCGVLVIEWAEKIGDAIPDETISVKFTYLDETVRKIEISGSSERITPLEMILKRSG